MAIHDWRRVDAGIFHHFHQAWITELARALNRGLLPPDHYALAEQITGGPGPDVVALQGPTNGTPASRSPGSAVALASAPPRVWFRAKTETDRYAAKAKAVAIRHTSNHRVVAVIEIVSPGNKSHRQALRAFAEKAVELLRAGIHLLVLDLFPTSSRDPEGIHKAIWDEVEDAPFTLPADKRLTLAAYLGYPIPEAFVEPTAVGMELVEMPLFLNREEYVPVLLAATYTAAWEAVPTFWQNVLASPAAQPGSPS